MPLELRQTAVFIDWLTALRDGAGRRVIQRRLRRMELGLIGDIKAVGNGVSEIRIDFGPGYRIYFVRRGMQVIILLCGGDKGGQDRDIARAKTIAAELE